MLDYHLPLIVMLPENIRGHYPRSHPFAQILDRASDDRIWRAIADCPPGMTWRDSVEFVGRRVVERIAS